MTVPSVDGREVAVRPLDASRPGEANFVRMSWFDSYKFSWTPWPSLAEWEAQPEDFRSKFRQMVAGRFSKDRISRPRRQTWLEGQRALIHAAVAQDPIFVACLKEDHGVLFGFLACRFASGLSDEGRLIVNYAYVSRDVRKRGIARHLAEEAQVSPNPFIHR